MLGLLFLKKKSHYGGSLSTHKVCISWKVVNIQTIHLIRFSIIMLVVRKENNHFLSNIIFKENPFSPNYR